MNFDSISNVQQMAVKLYEKDPSKLTSIDEPLPNVSTNSDVSDDEDSNQAVTMTDIKEEPVEVVGQGKTGQYTSATTPQPGLPDRTSFSSGQEDMQTDSETVGCKMDG